MRREEKRGGGERTKGRSRGGEERKRGRGEVEDEGGDEEEDV